MKEKINEFLDYLLYEKKYSDKTIKNYEIDLDKYNEYLNKNNLNYLKIKYSSISEFIILIKKSGYKNNSINRLLSSLRSFYNFLEKQNIINNNPFNLVSNLKEERKLPNYFKYNEFNLMLDILKENDPLTIRNRLILEMLLATGMRVSELVNVKILDMNLKENEIKVRGKGNKERIVYYGSYCKEKLYYYLKDSRKVLLNEKQSEYLFINNNGGKLTDRGVRYIIDQIISKSAIKNKITPHSFRHTFASILLNEGCDIRSVQELLGHANLSTTSIYTHLTNEQIRKTYLNAHPRAKM